MDEGVLGLARFHAEKAGVAADIHFQQRTFAELSSKRPYGCVICNPPYGERMGRSAEALALHRAMPDVFRRLKTWSFFILTALPDFEAVIGQSATRRRKLYNGRIECTYYQFWDRSREEEIRNRKDPKSETNPRIRRNRKTGNKSEYGNRNDRNGFEHFSFGIRICLRIPHSAISRIFAPPARPLLPPSSAVSRPRPWSRPRSSGRD